MEIIERKTTVDASISGTDFKGAVHIVNNKIERLEIELNNKGISQHIAIENEEQARSLVQELSRVLTYIDDERNVGVSDINMDIAAGRYGERVNTMSDE